MLSAMCVPDMQGSQGTFSFYSTAEDGSDAIGGRRYRVELDGDSFAAELAGPPNPIRRDGGEVTAKFKVRIDRDKGRGRLEIGRKKYELALGEFTEWVPVVFRLGLGMKMRGICRFRLLSIEPEVKLYVTPINIDPENPILPISHPKVFSRFLSKLCGRYATLGLAEDTWALNEGALDEDAFLEQAWANHSEREAMFFEMLRRTRRGVIACVFDGTDRIQHMFMRYDDEGHPAAADISEEENARYAAVIDDTYRRMDEMVGRVMEQVDHADPNTLLAVISDHGFRTFRYGVNLNNWLRDNGYLVLEEGREEAGPWLEGVDWSRTRAFALGLGGVFLNVRGRERDGIVEPEEIDSLAAELAGKLTGLRDPERDMLVVREAYTASALYQGPYASEAPDIIVGYADSWRVSWDGARGLIGGETFTENTRAWSGDHCIDPELVPGVLITNQPLDAREAAISDIAPTVLDLFGVNAPRFMDGRSLAT
jgi:hypothetical protein